MRKKLRWFHSPLGFRRLCRQFSPLFRNTFLLTLGICVLVAGVSLSWPRPQAVPAFAPAGEEEGEARERGLAATLLRLLPWDLKEFLFDSIPLLSQMEEEPEPGEAPQKESTFWDRFLQGITQMSFSDPSTIISGQVLVFSHLKPGEGEGNRDSPREDFEAVQPEPVSFPPSGQVEETMATGEPRVAIFHTHTSETYMPLHGKSHIYDQTAGIVTVGAKLKDELESRGIAVIHDTTPHDFEIYRQAYTRSAETVARLIEQHSHLDIIIDLHRDAPLASASESRALTTTEMGGREVARILMVVGTDRMGLEHPNWSENHQFALQLHQYMEAMHPGLSRGVRVSQARYNQHLFPQMLLIEVGGVHNTLDEAIEAAKCLADVLEALLAGE